MTRLFSPDFKEECYKCGTSPTVIVVGHGQPHTRLCGCCFFSDDDMIDPSNWNSNGDSDEN